MNVITKETAETGVAFRAGVKGLPYNDQVGPRPDLTVIGDVPQRAIGTHYETVERLAGLSDPLAAYEAGRALRMVGTILDHDGSPPEHGPLFLSHLASAVLTFALRGERQPWGAEDVAFVFLEIFHPAEAPEDLRDLTRRAIVEYARERPSMIIR